MVNILAYSHDYFGSLDVISEYFYTGRPYKMIIERLRVVHGINKR